MNLIDTRFKGYVTFYKTQTRQSDITDYLYTYLHTNQTMRAQSVTFLTKTLLYWVAKQARI